MRSDEVTPETWAIIGGRPEDRPGAPLNVPMMPASNFLYGADRGYSREEGTEGWEAFEAVVGGLEGGDAVAFASGMGACAAVLGQLPLNARLVLGDDCYQGVAKLVEAGARDRGWQVERLPVADERWLQRAGEADMLWVESPSNPLLEVADLAAICAAPRRDGTKLVVDNTFATPLQQRPLQLGADVVVHSATKFLGGHSDLLLGVAVTRSPDQLEQHAEGSRRLRRDARNARVLSRPAWNAYLAAAPASGVGQRRGADVSPRHGLGRRAGSLSRLRRHRQLRARDAAAADQACQSTRIIRHATSLGGVETTMERRNTHPGQEHIPAGLIRMSVGCEDVDDLWDDLRVGAPEKLRPRSAFNYRS